MDTFNKYIRQFKCEKGTPYTHTSITDPPISLHIPNDKLDEFYDEYATAIVKGRKMYITEKPENPSPMRVDLDFRFKLVIPIVGEEVDLKREYDNRMIERVILFYSKTLLEYLDITEDKLKVYVLEKPRPTEYRGRIKDGIHMIWPNLVITHNLQHLIRKRIIESGNEIFEGIPLINSYDDIVDKAIIDKNNWQLYKSRKPESQAYDITKVYRYDFATKSIIIEKNPSASEELGLVKILSMRNKTDQICNVKNEKIEEVDQYVKHILPSMDEKKKQKLHSQIFGKTKNVTKNFLADDEFALSQKLVEECLNPKRAENYEEWIKLGWALRNIDYRLLESWTKFSCVSSKYVEGECHMFWDKMRQDTMGIGTLKWWARQDNIDIYNKIIDESIIDLIDKCISSGGAHYDVAKVIHCMYKDHFRASSKDTWYMYSKNEHRWTRSRDGMKLRRILSEDVCHKFIQRSIHWSSKSMNEQDKVLKDIYNVKNKVLNEICLRLKNSGYKDSVMKECKSLFTDEKFEETLDSHPHLLGFENGVYDLHMHEFREGLPDDYINYTTGRYYIPYDEETVEAKEISTYLSQVFTDLSIRKYMLDVFACTIDGSIRQEKFYIFTGFGSNSKSILLNLMQKALGDYYCILPIALLTQKRTSSNAAQGELERTKGRRLAVMQEPGESEKLNIGLMKELSGGDRILTRGLFKEPIEFRPQFKMVMTCNDLPDVPSDDGGTWRRIKVIEYTSKFLDNPDASNPKEFPIDPDIMDKLEKWSDTFISMLINHHKMIDPKNIFEPSEVNKATQQYKKNNDVIGQYIDDKIQKDERCTKKMMLNKIYSDFRGYATVILKGKKIPDRNQMKAYFEKVYGPYNNNEGWRGFRFKSDISDADSDIE